MVIVELPTKVHERTAREFESEFLTAAGNGREVAKGGSMTARRAANPNKEADATFGPKRSTLNRTPLPALRTVGNWATLAVEVGRSQTWTSLEAAAQWWCDYSGIQYILLLKVSRQGIQMRYALYDIAVLGTLPAPTASGTFRRRTTAQPAVNVSFDMRRILSIPSNAALPPDHSDLPAALERMESQQEPPAGGGPKGPITEENIRNAILDREIIDVTTPSDGEEAETEARTTLTTKKHTEYKEQEAEVEAMSDTSELPRLIQNTIKAQVEGDLMHMPSSQFKVYPNFQSRKQLTNEFFMGIKNSANDPKRVAQMLQEAKQICYDQGHHTVHIICWTREMAIKWNKEFKTLSFRNRQFPLKNAHEEEEPLSQDNTQRTTQMWARQIGLDGIRNEKPQDRYHVRLMFI
ncbi:uncharacterized protein PITG_09302 [Phytophthora infestans T30-4]|uniref:Uncharacterized protein n=1 Tax=Phytophthora infestans (strain T30-4) TaxID=403677 RepID=D0NBD3_PHYIT|nr:uncharacterized protein PITG_09302 [Phytophthora infestans T30-4]EEY55362.1 conserved hypothetical protein [Phytophthora infestans T30-4]|eukprot:XP_002903586.1 conserved hypothetical protein [Phytophthora infestans T30-4]